VRIGIDAFHLRHGQWKNIFSFLHPVRELQRSSTRSAFWPILFNNVSGVFMQFHRLAAVLLVLGAGVAQAQPVVQGGIVTDPAGRTLYVFDKDQPGASNCSGPCLQAWPAYSAEAAAGAKLHAKASRLATQQWAWNNKPLYYFAGDAQPGDKAGDGSGGVWHIVKPPVAATSAAAAPTSGY
jgi:predicted lipoprotein with Yx(FWY)xxD motif